MLKNFTGNEIVLVIAMFCYVSGSDYDANKQKPDLIRIGLSNFHGLGNCLNKMLPLVDGFSCVACSDDNFVCIRHHFLRNLEKQLLERVKNQCEFIFYPRRFV